MSEVRLAEKEIAERAFEPIETLQVRVGDVPTRAMGGSEGAASRPPPRMAAVPPEVEALLATVDDPELRESIRRAVGLSLGRTR